MEAYRYQIAKEKLERIKDEIFDKEMRELINSCDDPRQREIANHLRKVFLGRA